MKVSYSCLFVMVSMIYGLTGCGAFQSKVDFDKKEGALQAHQVFSDDPSDSESFDDGNIQNNNGNNQQDDGNTGTNPPVVQPPIIQPPVIQPPVVNAPPFSIRVTNVCSDRQLDKIGFSVTSASELKVEIVKNGQIVCSLTNTGSIRSQIGNKNLQIPQSCSQFVSSSEVKNSKDSPAQLKILGRKGGAWKMLNYEGAPFQVLYDEGSRVPFIGNLLINKKCDRRASPLFVDLRDNDKNGGDYLSSVEDGVQFNILGFNAKKKFAIKNNTPIQISWFQKPEFKLLVLPNEEGKVLGIDQLFGDNTLGPDSRFGLDDLFKNGEESGYAALVKFDGLQSVKGLFVTPKSRQDLIKRKSLFSKYQAEAKKRDLMIDREDAVYHALKLWGDANSDGVAQPSEMSSLAEEGIVAIDLTYDKDGPYSEFDKHGNEIKFKSIVIRCTDSGKVCQGLTSGSKSVDYEAIKEGAVETEHKVIFDVWFNVSKGISAHQ